MSEMSDMKLQMILPKKYFVILYSENLFVTLKANYV